MGMKVQCEGLHVVSPSQVKDENRNNFSVCAHLNTLHTVCVSADYAYSS